MTLIGFERPSKIQSFLLLTFSVTVFMLGEKKCLYAMGPSKETFPGLFAMLMQLFKIDKKMNGLFETEAPFRSAELISSDNFGI